MKKSPLFVLTIIFIVSCTNNRVTVEQQNSNEQTPEIFDGERNLDISSFTKRTGYGIDIIQELFDEAVENDKGLKAVTSALEQVRELKSDSLGSYRTYMRNNQHYWDALARYSGQLSDSTLQRDVLKLVGKLKDKQSKRTSLLNKLVADIDSTERILADMEILMKIIVTEPMMDNYQRNELPSIQTLESVKHTLDSSVGIVEPYTKIQK